MIADALVSMIQAGITDLKGFHALIRESTRIQDTRFAIPITPKKQACYEYVEKKGRTYPAS